MVDVKKLVSAKGVGQSEPRDEVQIALKSKDVASSEKIVKNLL